MASEAYLWLCMHMRSMHALSSGVHHYGDFARLDSSANSGDAFVISMFFFVMNFGSYSEPSFESTYASLLLMAFLLLVLMLCHMSQQYASDGQQVETRCIQPPC